jgi:hypothetical protein
MVGVCAATRERERASDNAQSYGGCGQSCARCRRYIISSSSCLSCSIVASHASPVPFLQAARIPCSLTASPCHLHHVAHVKRAKRALKTLDALFYEWCYQLLEVIITLHTPKLLTNDSYPKTRHWAREIAQSYRLQDGPELLSSSQRTNSQKANIFWKPVVLCST